MSDVGPETKPATRRYAVFGGVYNNWLALEAVLDDAARRGAEQLFCLGDLGGFGPYPNRIPPILIERGVVTMQGNYDHSIGNRLADCACGYSDPRDNHYARISYAYTQTNTAERWLPYLRDLPLQEVKIDRSFVAEMHRRSEEFTIVRSMIDLGHNLGLKVVEKRITRDEVYIADEAFFTGTAAEVTPIREVDGRQIGCGSRGPVSTRLQQLYFDTVNGRNAKHLEWLTPVR